MSAAQTSAAAAFVVLASHCIDCEACRPDVDRPEAARPECPEADRLYRAWRQTEREGGL